MNRSLEFIDHLESGAREEKLEEVDGGPGSSEWTLLALNEWKHKTSHISRSFPTRLINTWQ